MNKKKLPRAIRPDAEVEAAAAAAPEVVASESPPSPPRAKAKPKPAVEEAVRPAPPDEGAPAMAEEAGTPEASDDPRRAAAERIVKRFSLWSGAAGMIPVPFLDMAAVGGVEVQMLRRLSQIYDIPFSENRGKSLVAALAGATIPATSGIGAASLLKGMPVFGTVVGALMMPTLSAGATYAIGMAFIRHFASGGTLLDFNPPDHRDFIKAQNKKHEQSQQAESGAATA